MQLTWLRIVITGVSVSIILFAVSWLILSEGGKSANERKGDQQAKGGEKADPNKEKDLAKAAEKAREDLSMQEERRGARESSLAGNSQPESRDLRSGEGSRAMTTPASTARSCSMPATWNRRSLGAPTRATWPASTAGCRTRTTIRRRAEGLRRAIDYMGLAPGMALAGLPVDRVFIGSCTNNRLPDLEAAAAIVRGRKVAPGVTAMVVPGSGAVKRAAEAAGLDNVFRDAGFVWGEAGCSMCVGSNGDRGLPGERCISTTNRNFENCQGFGVRTHLASPETAAAAAIAGRIVDVRTFAGGAA